MVKVDDYADYRTFLKDHYEAIKRQKPKYSYRVFNRRAGVKSPSMYREVVQGLRNLTPDTAARFAKGLRLSERDGRYFDALVRFNQSLDPGAKQSALETLRTMRVWQRPKLIPTDLYSYYERWYHPVIRELACVLPWRGNYRILANALRPQITAKEARWSVKLLLRLGFLKKMKSGRLVQDNPSITTGSEVASLAVRALNRKMAGLGEEAIQAFPPSQRDISSIVAGVSSRGFKLVQAEIQAFKERVTKIVRDDRPSDRVYNLNVQWFPVSDPDFGTRLSKRSVS